MPPQSERAANGPPVAAVRLQVCKYIVSAKYKITVKIAGQHSSLFMYPSRPMRNGQWMRGQVSKMDATVCMYGSLIRVVCCPLMFRVGSLISILLDR